jgi:hypothetical protein
VVVDRIDLDQVQRVQNAGLGHKLERKMHLPEREPATHRIAHSRSDLGIDDIHVDGDVDERPARNPLERLDDHRLHPAPVEIADRVNHDAELPDECPLPGVERAHADESDSFRLHRRQAKPVAREAAAEPQRRGERHPVDIPGRRRLGRVQVAVSVEPQHAPRPRGCQPAQRAHRDRMVPAEHQWQPTLAAGSLDLVCDPRAGLEDLIQEPGALGARLTRLGDRRLNVPAVLDFDPGTLEPLAEARVADRRRAHVDAAAARAEIERRSDDRYTGRRHGHSLRPS